MYRYLSVAFAALTLALPASASATKSAIPDVFGKTIPINATLVGITPSPANPAFFTVRASWAGPTPVTGPLFVEVDRQNVLGQDGTLANDEQYQVGSAALMPGDADPTSWTGALASFGLQTPGTYYVQFYSTAANATCGPARGLCRFVSPVMPYTVAAKPAAATAPRPGPNPAAHGVTLSEANNDVLGDLNLITHRRPRALTFIDGSCRPAGTTTFNCHLSWRDNLFAYTGMLRYGVNDREHSIDFTFRGSRATKACMRHHTFQHCARSYRR